MQIVENGAKNIEICVSRGDGKREFLASEVVERIVAVIEAEEAAKPVEEGKTQ